MIAEESWLGYLGKMTGWLNFGFVLGLSAWFERVLTGFGVVVVMRDLRGLRETRCNDEGLTLLKASLISSSFDFWIWVKPRVYTFQYLRLLGCLWTGLRSWWDYLVYIKLIYYFWVNRIFWPAVWKSFWFYKYSIINAALTFI